MTVPKNKFILDATAGYRMMWFNKKHPNCIYLDQRPECEPDIVGDFRDLKQFPDETFRLIVFDPPHLLKKKGVQPMNLERCFGVLRAETWQSDLKHGFAECWRVLKPHGVLIFKWTNYSVSSDKILQLLSVKPLFYQVSASRDRKSRHGKRVRLVQTLWFCFMKIPEESEGAKQQW